MSETAGLTLPRRQLGRNLKALRREAGLTVAKAAHKLEVSVSTINRIEAGATGLRALEVQSMCMIYEASEQTIRALMALAGETRLRGWWENHNAINVEFHLYVGLEAAAETLLWYETELVPGLLQTAGYARTLISAGTLRLDEVAAEHRVQSRMRRQMVLTRPKGAPVLKVVLNEAVLRRHIGGKAIMADQLAKLLEFAKLPNIAIRVMPFTAGMHVGVNTGGFVLMEFPNSSTGLPDPPVVYLEGLVGSSYLEKEQVTGPYAQAHNDMWREALNEAASAKLIAGALKELKL